MAWQIAFLVIGRNPARYRPLMIAGIVEKLGHVAGVAVLYGQGRLSVADATAAGPDLVLSVLFIAAFATTPKFRSTAADHRSATGADVVPA